MTTSGESCGHYVCDILEEKSKSWYRTNDNSIPKPIEVDEVSRQGYIILYKQKNNLC